ncbi:MAG: SDR family NAD(P)-dependent oxidoreductase [Pseudomonadales bacterium]|nr:SDR family NAD(P)-dependent oxidoreductase [Pseudomonadales bacterium]
MSRHAISYNARAVVTGAGNGIGRAFAMELHRRGGKVVCSDIDFESADQTASFIRSKGGSALAVKCDVAALGDVKQLADTAREWFGEPTSLLVNNAGVGIGGQCVEEISIDDWQWVMGINLWGVIHGCHVFVPELKAQGRGGVINVASAASFGAAPMMAAYNTTKSAVVSLTETLHSEVFSYGVHVSALCPTFVKTDVIKNARMAASSKGKLMGREKAQSLMDKLGHSPESVVVKSLNGLDKNKIHVLPQLDARIAWRFKRMSPSQFIRFSGLMASQLD